MQCSQCSQEVVNEARFYSQCGHQLRLVCQSCDTENPSGAASATTAGRASSSRVVMEKVCLLGVVRVFRHHLRL